MQHGPRRHLALGLFRLTQLVIAQRANPQFQGEHPLPYLRRALSLVQRRLSMPARLALIREGLRRVAADDWILLLVQLVDQSRRSRSADEVHCALQAGIDYLAHDYSHLLRLAADRLNVLANDVNACGPTVHGSLSGP